MDFLAIATILILLHWCKLCANFFALYGYDEGLAESRKQQQSHR